MSILIIAEKSKAAKAIAEALGPFKTIKISKYIYVYYVASKNSYVLPLRGHILEYRNTEIYKKWGNPPPRQIIIDSNSIKKYPTKYAIPYIKLLKDYGKICNHCIIATDADVEGCNIGLFDAFPFIKNVNKNITISQVWLSSLQKSEILDKFNHQSSPRWSWGETGEARAILDAIIGFSATREITNTSKIAFNNPDYKFISIGRVQTSLLYLIYLREKEITDFKSEPYYTIDAILSQNNFRIKTFHKLNPFKKKTLRLAQEIYKKIKDSKEAVIIENLQKQHKKRPPAPLNTNKALQLLTKRLRISASNALNTMNDLYLDRIISYPRTESDVYRDNFIHKPLIEDFTIHSLYGKYSKSLIKEGRFTPTKGRKDAGDHPPITPLLNLELNNPKFKSDIHKKVYDILTRHYLALFGNNALEINTLLRVEINKELFKTTISSLKSEGFLEIIPSLKRQYEPRYTIKGTKLDIEKIGCEKKETKPLMRYNDSNLLRLMEKNHLGTKATRPQIIQILQKRKFIYRKKQQYFISELGDFLIESLKDVWIDFLEPKFTKFIENLLEDIKEQRKSMQEVVNYVKKIFLDLFDKFLGNKDEFNLKLNIFKQNYKANDLTKRVLAKNQVTTSMCPYCKSFPMNLVILQQFKRFLVCSDNACVKNNKSYLSVPKKGTITILKKSHCYYCGFNIFQITIKKNYRSFNYFLCPKCWNDGLKEQVRGKGFCSQCNGHKIVANQCVNW